MTAATRYSLLLKGKITKEQFLYEVRKDSQLPFITPLTSFNDAVTMLKQRRIVVENFDAPVKEVSNEDPYTQGFMAGERGDEYQDCPFMQDENPEEYEAWCDGWSDANAKTEEEVPAGLSGADEKMIGDYEDNMANSEMSKHDSEMYREEEAPSLREQVQEFVQKAMEGGSSMDEAKEQAREYFSTEKAALNEAAKPKLGIDQVNPYELKKGTDYEMGYADKPAPSWAEMSLMDIAGDFAKAQAKALKNLNKDPMYYTRLQANGGKKEKKVTEKKVQSDGYIKAKAPKVVKEGIKTSVQKIREFVTGQLRKETQLVKSATTGATIDIIPDNQATQMKADLQKKGVKAVTTKV